MSKVKISELTKEDAAKYMDFSLLHPQFGDDHILKGIEDQKKYKFGAFYVLGHWIPLAMDELGEFTKENNLQIGSVAAFPYGAAMTESKINQVENQLKLGIDVIDLVGNVSYLKNKDYDKYTYELNEFAKACQAYDAVSKIIIRSGYLTNEEMEIATELVAESDVDYLKTSTGTGPTGRPNIHDIKLIMDKLNELGTDTKFKVAGIKAPKVLLAYEFIKMGADKLGTSGAVDMVESLPIVQEMIFQND